MQHLTMRISGMSCGGCVSAVRDALRAVPGVHVDSVAVGSATASYDESRTTPAVLAQAIQKAGYQPHAVGVPVAPPVTDGARCGCGHSHAPTAAKR